TGLHFADIEKLLEVLNRLVDQGNTVVIIEHNLDVIKTADWVIDLGPEGGDDGGRVMAIGTPEALARQAEKSYTGQFLRTALAAGAAWTGSRTARSRSAGRRASARPSACSSRRPSTSAASRPATRSGWTTA